MSPSATATKNRKTEPKVPSPLGLAIQAAVDASGLCTVHQPDRLYQCTYQLIASGTVFAFERVTKNHITIWLPATAAVETAVTSQGIVIPSISVPYPYTDEPERYGRLSSLKQVPELANEKLFAVKVVSVGQIMGILGAGI